MLAGARRPDAVEDGVDDVVVGLQVLDQQAALVTKYYRGDIGMLAWRADSQTSKPSLLQPSRISQHSLACSGVPINSALKKLGPSRSSSMWGGLRHIALNVLAATLLVVDLQPSSFRLVQ